MDDFTEDQRRFLIDADEELQDALHNEILDPDNSPVLTAFSLSIGEAYFEEECPEHGKHGGVEHIFVFGLFFNGSDEEAIRVVIPTDSNVGRLFTSKKFSKELRKRLAAYEERHNL